MPDTAKNIQRVTAAQFDEFVEMLDEVFSEHEPHNFRTRLPALYKADDQHSNCNLIIRREGQIAAALGVFPIDWRTRSGDSLKMAGIGGVSVRKQFRGQGLMKKLMKAAIELIEQEGYDLCYLGGQRQRYRYFGWERCGSRYRLRITKDNVRHDLPQDITNGLSLKKIEDEPGLFAQMQKLHRAQPTWCGRNFSPFRDYLRQWKKNGWAVLNKDGAVAAYIVGNPGISDVGELVACDSNSALAAVKLWIDCAGDSNFLFPTIPTEIRRKLLSLCEYPVVETTGNWRIFNWPKTVGTLLKLRQSTAPVVSGEITIGLIDKDISLRLWVSKTGAGCEKTEGKPDIRLDSCRAMSMLFGPAAPGAVVDLPDSAGVLESWCPLPLHLYLTDHV